MCGFLFHNNHQFSNPPDPSLVPLTSGLKIRDSRDPLFGFSGLLERLPELRRTATLENRLLQNVKQNHHVTQQFHS